MAGITIMGLGPGSPDQLTLEAWQVLQQAEEVFVRTSQHPTVAGLRDARVVELPIDGDDDWSGFKRALRTAEVDWRAVHAQVFKEHRAGFDRAFGRVAVHAKDERTLVVTLKRRCPYLLDLLAMPVFLPVHSSIERLGP